MIHAETCGCIRCDDSLALTGCFPHDLLMEGPCGSRSCLYTFIKSPVSELSVLTSSLRAAAPVSPVSKRPLILHML